MKADRGCDKGRHFPKPDGNDNLKPPLGFQRTDTGRFMVGQTRCHCRPPKWRGRALRRTQRSSVLQEINDATAGRSMLDL
jgi:hypothetical protein